mmetsp:Transcript_20604/g.43629  ORF Transcript_20604/g.43629 Transcript_20604/m.43629 type:complete len:277 (-) Transcript_20604:1222-2052(-)
MWNRSPLAVATVLSLSSPTPTHSANSTIPGCHAPFSPHEIYSPSSLVSVNSTNYRCHPEWSTHCSGSSNSPPGDPGTFASVAWTSLGDCNPSVDPLAISDSPTSSAYSDVNPGCPPPYSSDVPFLLGRRPGLPRRTRQPMLGPQRNRHRESVCGLFGILPRRGQVLAHGMGAAGNLSGKFGSHGGADEGRGKRHWGVSSALFEGRGLRTGGRGVKEGGVRVSVQEVPVKRLLRHSFARAGEQERGIGVDGIGMVRGEHGAHSESDKTGGGIFGGMS